MGIGRPATWLMDAAKASARVVGRGVMEHPVGLAAGAAALGFAHQMWSQVGPDLQEMATGDPEAIKHTAQASAQAIMIDHWNPDGRNDPYGELNAGRSVWGTSAYLYGNPIQGGRAGGISGSRVLGGNNLGSYPGRIPAGVRGSSGRNRPGGAEGSMVFGMHNLRR